jgi:hypothetical protein
VSATAVVQQSVCINGGAGVDAAAVKAVEWMQVNAATVNAAAVNAAAMNAAAMNAVAVNAVAVNAAEWMLQSGCSRTVSIFRGCQSLCSNSGCSGNKAAEWMQQQ